MTDKPRRRVMVRIEIEADDWQTVEHILFDIRSGLCSARLVGKNEARNCFSNGRNGSWSTASDEDESVTNESYVTALYAYLAEKDNEVKA